MGVLYLETRVRGSHRTRHGVALSHITLFLLMETGGSLFRNGNHASGGDVSIIGMIILGVGRVCILGDHES